MALTFLFFAVYLISAVLCSVADLGGIQRVPQGPNDILEVLRGWMATFGLCQKSVNLAPMLCILFVGARMRALQMDPKHGNPQWWAQWCFYICTYSVMVQAIMVVVVPLCITCECKQGASEGDVMFVMENSCCMALMTTVRYIALLALYGGFTAVIVSVFIIEHPTDVTLTPPISPAMQCVMNLTVQYFFIYLTLFVCITIQQFA